MQNRLRHYREQSGMTQHQLARLTGISQAHISKMELDVDNPNHRRMSSDHAHRIAKVLKVTAFDLTGSLDDAAFGLSEREIAKIAGIIAVMRAA